jgi:hypothetical protein
MTEGLQRIRIAEACGFDKSHWLELKGGVVFGTSGSLPDYPNDLNAMHEAEKICIVGSFDMEYRENLEPLCGQYAVIYHATAAQRAKAFLQTLNLWEE